MSVHELDWPLNEMRRKLLVGVDLCLLHLYFFPDRLRI